MQRTAGEDTYNYWYRGCHTSHIVIKLHDLLDASLHETGSAHGKISYM